MSTGVEETSVIYLVRHGECMGNVTARYLSPEQAVLSDNGKQQAKLLGALLRNEKFTIAQTSDYPRALETAQIILSQSAVSSDIPLQKNINLREKNFGILEGGRLISDGITALVASGQDILDYVPEGGETRMAVEDRIENFLQSMFAMVDHTDEAQTILAVTHGTMLAHFLAYLSRTPSKFTLKNWLPEYYKASPNTGYHKIAIQKNPPPNGPRELTILTAHGNQHLRALGADAFHKLTMEDEKMKSLKGCIQQ